MKKADALLGESSAIVGALSVAVDGRWTSAITAYNFVPLFISCGADADLPISTTQDTTNQPGSSTTDFKLPVHCNSILWLLYPDIISISCAFMDNLFYYYDNFPLQTLLSAVGDISAVAGTGQRDVGSGIHAGEILTN
jgi:hypothetical protein